MEQILDCFCTDINLYIALTQSHRPDETIPDSYNRCELGRKNYISEVIINTVNGAQ